MLNRSSLKDQALEVIRQDLVSGEIRPGEIHSAASMAARLGTSSGPVREAMLTLVEQGIMEVVPNRGFRVTDLSDHDLDEVHELRMMLEVPAMGRLAELGLGAHAGAVRTAARRCEEAARRQDLSEFLVTDREFHLGLLELLGNGRLVKFVGQLRDQTRLYGLQVLAREGRLQESAAEHVELLAAIDDGDAARTAQVMSRHLAHARSDWGPGPATALSPS